MAAPSGATPILGLRFPIQNDDVDVPRDIQALAEDVENKGSFIIGEIRWFGFVNPPTFWLPCDGTPREQGAYPELFSKIGPLWNTGGETGTQFGLPGMSGRSPVGPGTAVGGGVEAGAPNRVVATKWGVNAVVLSIAQMPQHRHGGSTGNASSPVGLLQNTAESTVVSGVGPYGGDGKTAFTHAHIINFEGNNAAHENANPSISVPVFIYAGRA